MKKDGGKPLVHPSSLIAAMGLALIVAFVVSGASLLYVEYTYANTLDKAGVALNWPWGTDLSIRIYGLNPTSAFRTYGGPSEGHNRLAHFALGTVVAGALSALRMRYAWWPLHPVGYLLMHTYVMEAIWFSVFLGWVLKVVVVRFGGAGVFRSARVVCIGVIVGELFAAGFWLVVSLVLHAMGREYTAINLLPI